jgi:hypothetical protein
LDDEGAIETPVPNSPKKLRRRQRSLSALRMNKSEARSTYKWRGSKKKVSINSPTVVDSTHISVMFGGMGGRVADSDIIGWIVNKWTTGGSRDQEGRPTP